MKYLIGNTALVVCLLFSTAPMWAQAKTPEELMASVLKAVESNDTRALKALAISKEDVKKYVWPAVAVNLAGRNMNSEKFAIQYQESSEGYGIQTLLGSSGGKRLQVSKVTLPKPLKETKTYKLYAAPSVTVKGEDGQDNVLALVGGILDEGGVFKVSTYYVVKR